jgi:hypothetical protein
MFGLTGLIFDLMPWDAYRIRLSMLAKCSKTVHDIFTLAAWHKTVKPQRQTLAKTSDNVQKRAG